MTEEAKFLLSKLQKLGLDRDLAIEIVLDTLGDSRVYDL